MAAANIITAGAADFSGGQDASKIPDRIGSSCYYQGVNVSTKRQVLHPRWGWRGVKITYPKGSVYNRNKQHFTYEQIFKQGKFQLFDTLTITNKEYIIIVISGIIFILNPRTFTLSVIDISDGSLLNPRVARLNGENAGKYYIIHDFPGRPVFVEGLSARRSNALDLEVPISMIGTYNQSRLFISNAGNELTGGDPVGNTAATNPPITFEEVLLSGASYFAQVFGLPTGDDNLPIIAMTFLPVIDTGTGIGPLLVGTKKALYSYAVNNPRSQWQSGQLGSLIAYSSGIAGPKAHCSVNSDMYYMASDGHARILSMSRNEQGKWARVPVSREVEPWMVQNDASLINFSFVSYFQNKVFFSVNPYRTTALDVATGKRIADYAFGGLVVLELDNVTAFGQAGQPTWAGLWTGIRPTAMVNIGNQAFAMAKNGSANELWELDSSITYDVDQEGHIRYVESIIYTKEYDFESPFINKAIHSMDFNLSELAGDLNIDVAYKPAHGSKFLKWRSFSAAVPWRSHEVPEDEFINGYAAQVERDITIGTPDETGVCDPGTLDLYDVFRKIQLRIKISAKYWELHEFALKAVALPKDENDTGCDAKPPIPTPVQFLDDWSIGEFNICRQQQIQT